MTRVRLAFVEKPKEAEARPRARPGHTSFPGRAPGNQPTEGQLGPLGRVPTAGLPWARATLLPSPTLNCGRKRSISMQQCKHAHYHLLNMHEETVLGWPSPIAQLWPPRPIRRHIHLPDG